MQFWSDVIFKFKLEECSFSTLRVLNYCYFCPVGLLGICVGPAGDGTSKPSSCCLSTLDTLVFSCSVYKHCGTPLCIRGFFWFLEFMLFINLSHFLKSLTNPLSFYKCWYSSFDFPFFLKTKFHLTFIHFMSFCFLFISLF